MTTPHWTPVEQHAPDLLDELMYMSMIDYGGTRIWQYKHVDTRRYLNLDDSGQAWRTAVHPDTGDISIQRIDWDQARAHLLS